MADKADMLKQLQDVIGKHMPGLVAGEMKEFVERAEDALEQLPVLKQKVNKLTDDLETANATISGLKKKEESVISRESVVSAKEVEIQKREDRIELETYKFKMEVMGERLKDSKEFMLMLAKNPRVIEFMAHHHMESVPVADQFGGSHLETKHTDTHGQSTKIETKDDNQDTTGAPKE
jgi:hypothetical protein